MSTFQDVVTWQAETFGEGRTLAGVAQHLKQEAEEILDCLWQEGKKADVREEVADCMFLVWQMADLLGLNEEGLHLEVQKKLVLNKQRQWHSPDEKGIINHVLGNENEAKNTTEENR